MSAARKTVVTALTLLCPAMMATLTGCSLGPQTIASSDISSQTTAAPAIKGHVHGGAFPIEDATITLMRTQTNSSSSYGSAAVSLESTQSDSNGDFNFSGTVTNTTCPAGEFAYIVVTGGLSANVVTGTVNTSNENFNVVQVAALDDCADLVSNYNNLEVYVSELSTVAAAYALGNFITVVDPSSPGTQTVNIGSPQNNNQTTGSCSGIGTAMACQGAGLTHAFTNAKNLVNAVSTNGTIPSGMANSVTPKNANAVVPQAMINTIGNILQDCVDSLSTSTACSTLFSDTNLSGTAPKNTLEVALQLAKYPVQSASTISTIWQLQSNHSYFSPWLAVAPPAFTVALSYRTNAEGGSITYPVDIALDEDDNAYVLYGSAAPSSTTDTGVAVFGATGDALGEQSSAGLTAKYGHFGYPTQIAVDNNQNFYLSNDSTSNGAVLTGSYSNATSETGLAYGADLANAAGLAVDDHNNVWVSAATTSSDSILEYTASALIAGSASSTFKSAKTGYSVVGLAVDPDQDIWGISGGAGNATIVYLNNAGGSGGGSIQTPSYSATPIYSVLTAGAGSSIAPATGNTATDYVYIPLKGQLNYEEVTGTTKGITVEPATTSSPMTVSGALVPSRSVIDGGTVGNGAASTSGQGNVWWTDNEGSGDIYVYTYSTGKSGGFTPCFEQTDGSESQCAATGNNYLTGASVDSAGNLWVASSLGGTVFEILGVAAPTWPLLSYGNPGTNPQ